MAQECLPKQGNHNQEAEDTQAANLGVRQDIRNQEEDSRAASQQERSQCRMGEARKHEKGWDTQAANLRA